MTTKPISLDLKKWNPAERIKAIADKAMARSNMAAFLHPPLGVMPRRKGGGDFSELAFPKDRLENRIGKQRPGPRKRAYSGGGARGGNALFHS